MEAARFSALRWRVKETTALGAALLAGRSIGLWTSNVQLAGPVGAGPVCERHAGAALGQLEATIRGDGNIDHFSVGSLRFDAPWAHLKVLSCDSTVAYIGSANVTGAGMAGPNLELGVLVRGPAVATVDRVLDLYIDGGRA